jgi:cytochrome b subunit of formate dehydrogenase
MVERGHEHNLSTYLRAWAGFLAGAVAVAISMQANYAIAVMDCGKATLPVAVIAVVVLLVTAAGSWISFGIARAPDAEASPAVRLAARVSAGFAAMMGLVLLLHLLAALLYGGCEL